MKFEEILPHIRNGEPFYKRKKLTIHNDECFVWNGEHIVSYYDNCVFIGYSLEHVFDDDWELGVPEKKDYIAEIGGFKITELVFDNEKETDSNDKI